MRNVRVADVQMEGAAGDKEANPSARHGLVSGREPGP
jgi:hypothetical protein